MNIKNRANYAPTPGKIFTEPSMTVPDQSMSMKTIMERFAKGLPLPDQKVELYDEESDGIRPQLLDLVDLQEMKMYNTEKIKDLEIRANNEKTEAETKKRKKQDEAEKTLFEKFKNVVKGDNIAEGQ